MMAYGPDRLSLAVLCFEKGVIVDPDTVGPFVFCWEPKSISSSAMSCWVERKVKDKANPRDATPEKQPAETLEVSGTWRTRAYGV